MIQEAFIRAWGALARFRSGAPFRPWLLTIVANEARNRGRRAKRQLRLSELVGAETRLSGDAVPSPEAAVVAKEGFGVVVVALGRLSDNDQEIISLRYLLDFSEEEIAGVLGVRRGTVKSRLSRAMDRLRVEMGVA